jgi:hypothetical protein
MRRAEGHVRVDAIINEAFAFNNITGIRTDLNHIVFLVRRSGG